MFDEIHCIQIHHYVKYESSKEEANVFGGWFAFTITITTTTYYPTSTDSNYHHDDNEISLCFKFLCISFNKKIIFFVRIFVEFALDGSHYMCSIYSIVSLH